MFKEFQTYLMKSTNELVQSLQTDKRSSRNNVARLSHVYDEPTDSVTTSKHKSQ